MSSLTKKRTKMTAGIGMIKYSGFLKKMMYRNFDPQYLKEQKQNKTKQWKN